MTKAPCLLVERQRFRSCVSLLAGQLAHVVSRTHLALQIRVLPNAVAHEVAA